MTIFIALVVLPTIVVVFTVIVAAAARIMEKR
jgi:hypothetical protein